MSLYVHPENQKLLWTTIQTSPMFRTDTEHAEWFRSVIETFYANLQHQNDLTPEQLRDVNMDTILYMVRELKRRKTAGPEKGGGASPSPTRGEPPRASGDVPLPAWLMSVPTKNYGGDALPVGVENFVNGEITGRTEIVKGSHPFYEKLYEPNYIYDGGNTTSFSTFEGSDEPRREHVEIIPRTTLNPFSTPMLTKTLNIDTRFRDNFYTTDSANFTFNLPTSIRKVMSMQLTAYELPITFYGLSASYGNNYFTITCCYIDETTVAGNQPSSTAERKFAQKTIIVSDGNYSATDLITVLNAGLRPLTADGAYKNTRTPDSAFNDIQFSFDVNTNGSGSAKLTLALDPVSVGDTHTTLYFNLDFTLDINGNADNTPITSRIGWNLGFTQPYYTFDPSTGGTCSYTSDTIPEPAALRYIYLVVNDFNNNVNNHFVGAFNNWILNNNILARIPINAQYFSIMMENDKTQHMEPRVYFGPVDIQRLQLQLLDDHGRILDINRANYSLCLTFKTLNE
jgi:hypothetical protein